MRSFDFPNHLFPNWCVPNLRGHYPSNICKNTLWYKCQKFTEIYANTREMYAYPQFRLIREKTTVVPLLVD